MGLVGYLGEEQHVERLPEGVYPATSDDVQGLIAQGRRVAEILEIARDIAGKLLEEQNLKGAVCPLRTIPDHSDLAVVMET